MDFSERWQLWLFRAGVDYRLALALMTCDHQDRYRVEVNELVPGLEPSSVTLNLLRTMNIN